jgi:hypothetical protein
MMGKAKNGGRKNFTAPSQGGEDQEEETEDVNFPLLEILK